MAKLGPVLASLESHLRCARASWRCAQANCDCAQASRRCARANCDCVSHRGWPRANRNRVSHRGWLRVNRNYVSHPKLASGESYCLVRVVAALCESGLPRPGELWLLGRAVASGESMCQANEGAQLPAQTMKETDCWLFNVVHADMVGWLLPWWITNDS
jgi:hypothetical protein